MDDVIVQDMGVNYDKTRVSERPFHGRGRETRRLDTAFSSPRSELIVMYGRRRVGKTELLRRFTHDKQPFFFTASRESSQGQIQRLLTGLAEFAGDPLLSKLRLTTWSDALTVIAQVVRNRPGKTVVVLDEFQWMCRGRSSLLSDLQRLWDFEWRDSNGVYLVLCGSAISFMVGEVLARKSPLFGRRTASIHLEPLDAADAVGFFSGRGHFEMAEALICVGGVPAYLERFEGPRSVRAVLDDEAFSKDGYLVEEVEFVLGEQLRQKERYLELCGHLAAGTSTLADLSRRTGMNKGQLDFYLARLEVLGFVEKFRPIGKPRTSKTVRLRLADEYLRFYFRFIEPNRDRIRLRRGGYAFDRMTGDGWDAYLGLGFEFFVRRNLGALTETLGVADVLTRSGTYWHRNTRAREGVQIDLVLERSDGVTLIVECKWSRSPVGSELVSELERKCRAYPNPRKHTLQPVLVAAAGATPGVERAGVQVVTLEDLLRSNRE